MHLRPAGHRCPESVRSDSSGGAGSGDARLRGGDLAALELKIDLQADVSSDAAHVDIVVIAFRFQFAEAIHHLAKQLEA